MSRQDWRSFIEQVEKSGPSEFIRISDEVSPAYEITALIAELERTINTSPFYTIPASTEDLTSCDARLSPEGDIELEYHFRNGSWLQVKRNERIEYMELNVRLNQKLTDQPETILARAERAAFGASGCGIYWLQSETHPSADDRKVTETLFHGDICNCQARIRHSGSSHAVELMLKSAC